MSRLIVADNSGTPWVEITLECDGELWVARCRDHGQVSMDSDHHRDVVEDAEIHVDNEHEGSTER